MRPAAAVALLAAACDGAPEPVDAAGVEAAFRALHAPIYEAYALGPERDALHDHLAASFTGESLTEQYVEHWRTLVRMEEEQTGIRVTAVEYVDVALVPEDLPALRVDATWFVRGVVRHQRHRHPRINRYRAIYTLVSTPGGLRIADTRMRDLARVASQVAPGDVFDLGQGSGADAGFIDPLELFEGGLFDTDDGAAP